MPCFRHRTGRGDTFAVECYPKCTAFFFFKKKKKNTKSLYFLVFKAADSFLALTD